jgi:predicted DsbA family dithiol-disulfide isomerase
LNEGEVKDVLSTNTYADAVRQDIYEASQVGVSGVPFFVFNNKYAVSGAQDSRSFFRSIAKVVFRMDTQTVPKQLAR